jgi:hypothetical protein
VGNQVVQYNFLAGFEGAECHTAPVAPASIKYCHPALQFFVDFHPGMINV